MSFAETTSRTLPPLSAALGHSSSAMHPGSLRPPLLPNAFLVNYGAVQHSPVTPASYLATAKPQHQAAAAIANPQQTPLPAQPIPVPAQTTPTILPKLGADYVSPPPSLLPSPSIRDFPDQRISPTLTSVSSNLSGSPPSHPYYPQPSSSSEHHGHHHHHRHHSQPNSPGHHYGASLSHNGSHRAEPSPDEVLAEKRRRNAGASARFRDRRKQRERETQDRCQYLERRVQELEEALAHATGGVLPERESKKRGRAGKHGRSGPNGNGMSTNGGHRKESLAGRVSDLESQVVRTRIEREGAYRRIQELEKESKYLRSLLSDNPNVLPRSSFTSASEFSKSSRSSYDDRDRGNDIDTRSNRSPPSHSETKSHSRYTSYRPYPIDTQSTRSWEPSGSQSPRTTSTMSVTSDDEDASPRSSNGSLSSPQ